MQAAGQKIIRDPVHDIIAFHTHRPVDALLFRLVNAAEFQRLRRIRQLGLAALAYPGADHSRYSHALGVMQTARAMLAHLREEVRLDPLQELLTVAGALLHDLGHGPFSHVFERISGVHHEEATRKLLLDGQSEVHKTLADHDPQLPALLAAFLQCAPRTFYTDIISSGVDADRCDYLLRDNLMTGSRYGDFDLAWLVHALVVDPATMRLAIASKGVSAVEGYLQSRYHMYRNVYFHKVVRSAEGMVRLALQRARRLAVQERLPFPPVDHVVQDALRGHALTPAQFALFDDNSILECFKAWTFSDDPTLAQLSRGLLFRGLFKVIDLTGRAPREIEQARAIATEVSQAASGDPAYDFFIDEPADSPYRPVAQEAENEGIFVIDPAGGRRAFADVSPLVAAFDRRLHFTRLHVAPALRTSIQTRLRTLG